MKSVKWMKLAMAFTACALVGTACDDDDDDKFLVPESVQQAFNSQYSHVERLEWDRTCCGYIVAEFWKDGKEMEAWYNLEGVWQFTETELGKDIDQAGLPQAVADAFRNSGHANSRVDDIDLIEKAPGSSRFYTFEIDREPDDIYLHYAADGTFKGETNERDRYNAYLD